MESFEVGLEAGRFNLEADEVGLEGGRFRLELGGKGLGAGILKKGGLHLKSWEARLEDFELGVGLDTTNSGLDIGDVGWKIGDAELELGVVLELGRVGWET